MALTLLADVGGTNTRVALAEGAALRPGSILRYANHDFGSIGAILGRYLAETAPGPLSGACVAAAGPVLDGAVTMTNLRDASGAPWVIDGGAIAAATGTARVAVLNDLQAQGHALGRIAAGHLRRAIAGPEVAGAARLVVGLGTGVNAAPVHDTPAGRIVPPSECGHVALPVRDAEGLRLAAFLRKGLAERRETAFASVEEALSGRGLAALAAFAAADAATPAPPDSAAVLAALAAGDAVAAAAARLYVQVLGRFLADLALVHLPFGGIFLIGGMARAMAPHLARFGLEATFREPRRIDLLTADFAVQVVEDDYAALAGCAAFLAAAQA